MDFGQVELTAEQAEFAAEVRRFLGSIITEDVHNHERETGDGFNSDVHLALGARGWLAPTWPVEDGGAGLDPIRARILQLEMQRFEVPHIATSTTLLVWPAIEQFAEPAFRDELKKGIASGNVRICLGYTEPDGGSDIAAAKVKAVRDGDEWIINGSKMFTTGAQHCQYTFLITRTDPDLPKHKGLTMFLVPLDTAGVEVQGIRALSGERSNMVYFDNVSISDKYRLGGVNDGWTVLKGPLDDEHNMSTAASLVDLSLGHSFLRVLAPALTGALQWADETGRDGRRPADDPSVLARFGRIATDYEAGICTPGPMGRVKGSEVLIDSAADLIDLLGPLGVLQHGSEGVIAGGAADFAHRFAQGTATYGGTVEVFRTIIAQHILGLPRATFPGSKQFLPSGRRPATAGAPQS